jgi:peptidoglycan/LPS O-acetylase OafA/YrhL
VRRARRILPALVAVLLFTWALGWWVLLADEFSRLSRHVAAATSFIVNFALWNEVGYFDFMATTKPLQHLWSLGIEEQFYILWPMTLVIARKRKWDIRLVISIIAIVSFIANIVLTDRHAVMAFYFPGSRFWELMIGAHLACWMDDRQPSFPAILANALGLGGPGAIICDELFPRKHLVEQPRSNTIGQRMV